MLREMSEWKHHEDPSTDAEHRRVGWKRHEHDILWQDELWRPCPQTAFGAGSRRQEFECIGGRG